MVSKLGFVEAYKCVSCGKSFRRSGILYTCDACGPLRGTLDVIYDYEAARRALNRQTLNSCDDRSHWRYIDILPIDGRRHIGELHVGWTPLYRARQLEKELSLSALYVKDDGRNPSASYKDRASSVCVAHALENGAKIITAASTGNAASSLATFAAAAGLKTYIFVPERAPKPKVAQLLIYGAEVVMVRGSYDVAYDLCLEASKRWGWYNRSTAYNPVLGEGKKTGALELCEQLAWDLPHKVFVAVGDGCIIGGLWKGFSDFKKLGLIEKAPQLIGVQAQGSSALCEAFEEGKDEAFEPHPSTIADSICVGLPRDQLKALRAVRESGGRMVRVSDEEIKGAMRRLALSCGVFAEPAGAAPLSGLIKLAREEKGSIAGEKVAIFVTGNGLKDVDSAMAAAGKSPLIVEPDIEAVAAKIGL